MKIDEIMKKQAEARPTRDIFNAVMSVAPADTDSRTVNVAFSSEEPVERWFGKEILNHDANSVDLSRLLSGAPVLVNHDTNDQVGVVESAHIDPDRRGRAVLRFGKSQRATDIFNDIRDGIRQKISFMYEVKEYVQSEDDPETFIGMKWMPLEISSVSIPADDTVGVGRSLEIKPNIEVVKMTEEVKAPRLTWRRCNGKLPKLPRSA